MSDANSNPSEKMPMKLRLIAGFFGVLLVVGLGALAVADVQPAGTAENCYVFSMETKQRSGRYNHQSHVIVDSSCGSHIVRNIGLRTVIDVGKTYNFTLQGGVLGYETIVSATKVSQP
jgi:hypothetical protein